MQSVHSDDRKTASEPVEPATPAEPVAKPEEAQIEDRRSSTGGVAGGDRRAATAPRRVAARVRTLKGAEIHLPRRAPIKCLVRNISETGARIEVQAAILANTFDLVFDDATWPEVTCEVVWRKENAIGVQFEEPISVPLGIPPKR